jgi:putative tricarboxylic transport membrane protein
MPPGVTKDQQAFFTDLLKKVRATPEWKDYMEKGAFNQTYMDGEAFSGWLGKAEQQHRDLMKDAGFLAK